MFSKSKINEPGPKAPETPSTPAAPAASVPAAPGADFRPAAPKAKPPASILSSDLQIQGNLRTTGDIQIEGQVEGDIRAHLRCTERAYRLLVLRRCAGFRTLLYSPRALASKPACLP